IWLKEYLNLSGGRPKWATVADTLFSRAGVNRSREPGNDLYKNPFLQSWNASTHHARKLPADLIRLVKVGEKHKVRVAVRNPDEALKGLMPGWYHIGTLPGRQVNNSTSGKCLRDNHRAITIADCRTIAGRLENGRNHRTNATCTCYDCERDRTVNNCDNPQRCATAAKKIVDRLMLIWKPENEQAHDGLTLGTAERRQNHAARRKGDPITFNPTITARAPLATVFRVFVDEEDDGDMGPTRRPPKPFNVEPEKVTVYTDGSATDGDAKGPRAGYGIWCEDNQTLNEGKRVPPNYIQTNQTAEVYAVAALVAKIPPFAPVHIISD
ncbi:hypothetical protein C8T65DRAFT_533207, partial [Cerioporus squamosus]